MAQVVDVFIASPRDVGNEREHAEDVVQEVSKRTRDTLDIVLHPVSWKNFLPCATHSCSEKVQDRFTSRVHKCGIFIGILYQRYGTKIDEARNISGTEEEFHTAIENRQAIEILTYFRRPYNGSKKEIKTGSQIVKLRGLKGRLEEAGIFHHTYDDPINFRERLIIDLFEAVLKIATEAERRKQLSNFFRFGVHIRRQSPSVLLGYPPIHKHIQQHKKVSQRRYTYNWQERLLPNVVYEDMKCIQKIEAAVRLTGVQDISSVTIDIPRLRDPGNKIWLCLPRNDIASRQLAQLGSRAWFNFVKKPGADRPNIIWRPRKTKKPIEIQSPMAKYLQLQKRPKRNIWNPQFGAIVAKDYAIVGRFAMPNEGPTRNKYVPYYHYFIAGVRGLGTWGAGCFIERCSDELINIATKVDDVQVLLEVTFSNYRIVAVEDVSSKNQDYFNEQGEDNFIRSVIDQFR